MSTNKKIVSTTKSVLHSLNREVKTSEIYEVYSQLCGYKGWQVASALEIEFSPKVQLKLKQKLLNKINLMEPSLEKLVTLYLLNRDEKEFFNELPNLKPTPEQIDDLLDKIVNLNQTLEFYRKLFSLMVDDVALIKMFFDNQKFRSMLKTMSEALTKEDEIKEKERKALKSKQFDPMINWQEAGMDGFFLMQELEPTRQSEFFLENIHKAIDMFWNDDKDFLPFLKDMSPYSVFTFVSHDEEGHKSKISANPNILMVLKEKGIRFINNQGEVWTGGENPFSKLNKVSVISAKNKDSDTSLSKGVTYKIEGVNPRKNNSGDFLFIVSINGEIKPYTLPAAIISLDNLE